MRGLTSTVAPYSRYGLPLAMSAASSRLSAFNEPVTPNRFLGFWKRPVHYNVSGSNNFALLRELVSGQNRFRNRTARFISFLKRSTANDFRAGWPSLLLKLFLYFLRVNRYILCALCPWSTTYGLTVFPSAQFAGAATGETMTDTAEGRPEENCLMSVGYDRASNQRRGINGLNAPPPKLAQGSGTKPAKSNSSSE
jgi:hypothetical protein